MISTVRSRRDDRGDDRRDRRAKRASRWRGREALPFRGSIAAMPGRAAHALKSVVCDRATVQHFAQHDQRDDRDQDRAHEVVVEALERREQRAADAAGADDADHRRVAQVGVELVGGEADEAREHLRQHAVRERPIMNGAPVARTASTCFSEISSIASVKSLPMKPIEATVSARMPASAPKPTAFTNRIATITGWNERHSDDDERAPASVTHGRHQVARGERARSAARAAMPSAEARTAICRLSSQPLDAAAPSGAKSGGNMRATKRRAVARARSRTRSQRDVELRAGVDDVRARARATPTRAASQLSRERIELRGRQRSRATAHCQPVLAAVDLLAGCRRSRPSRRPVVHDACRPSCRRCGRRSAARARRCGC